MRTAIIQLGRLGDILNILPLARWLKDRPTMFVHRDFKDLADSVTYADFKVCNCPDYRSRGLAEAYADELGFENILVPQLVEGKSVSPHADCQSFCESAYDRCWLRNEFRQGVFDKIIIDRRHPEDEAVLLPSPEYGAGDLVLLNMRAVSNPAPREVTDRVWNALTMAGIPWLDLSQVRAKRFTDLLGLYDRAKCLVTVDTATLHLAGAHTIPYVALLADKPTPWFGSYCRGNVIHKARYGEAVTDPDFVNKIVKAVESAIEK